MTGDDHAFGGTAGRFDQFKAASPAGCSVVHWECVRGTSYIYPSSPSHERSGRPVRLGGFRGLRSRDDFRRPCLCRLDSRHAGRRVHVPAPAVHLEVHERPSARHPPAALRRLVRLVDAAEGRVGPRHPLRHQLLPLPRRLDRLAAGLHDRVGDDHAVRRYRRDADRRLPGAHPHGRRGVAAVSGDRRRAPR